MERENYLESLRKMRITNEKSGSTSEMVRHGKLRTISTQTNDGIWLDTKKPKRKRQSTDAIEDVKNIKGTVFVDGNNLISDGHGRYYMPVELNDVRPHRSSSHTHNRHRNYAPHSSNTEQVPSDISSQYGTYFANHSNYRPNPNGTFFANQHRYSNDRNDRKNTADRDTRTFGQSFQQPHFYRDSNDLFK